MTEPIKSLKQLASIEDRYEGASMLCPGCAHGIILRALLNAAGDHVVVANSTGCIEVSTGVYPYTTWSVPWLHIGFENSASGLSGIEAMYKALQKKGKLPQSDIKPKFLALGGDGSTYDIGFQFISGAMERNHNMMYVCLDNENYANTGGQRSSSTPIGSSTASAPAGSASYGKKQNKKPIVDVFGAHGIPYSAQASPSHWKDFIMKAQKGFDLEGAAFLNVVSPCTTEWRFPTKDTKLLADLAVETRVFPLYEIETDMETGAQKLTVNYKPKNKVPVEEYLSKQARFKHLFKPENKDILDAWQKRTDDHWNNLIKREEAGC